MAKGTKEGFASDFRRFFLRGLATLLPTVLTIVVLVKCFEFVQNNISVYINKGVIRLIVLAKHDYPQLRPEEIEQYISENPLSVATSPQDPAIEKRVRLWKLGKQWNQGWRSLIGFVLAILLVYFLGRMFAGYIGRKIWQMFESTVQQVPGFKQVYPYVKQVTDFLFGEKKIEFNRVVIIPYPSKGFWSIGLVTGCGFREVAEKTRQEFLTVFVPSSPTPVTGYVVYVKKEDAIDLPIPIDAALRFIVSGGVIVPGSQPLATQLADLPSDEAVAGAEARRGPENEKA
ncbi:MAG: hypothetical protein BWY71_00579 [Planctomycetes bacterium ADurb.Bin412]|nr:MAG: hypothetical protein BWY71_00579 [Planctomycetes bacterium ADurb.Bin412]